MTDNFYRKNMYLFLIIRLIVVIVVFTAFPSNDKDGSPFNKIDIVNETINLLTNNVSPHKYNYDVITFILMLLFLTL